MFRWPAALAGACLVLSALPAATAERSALPGAPPPPMAPGAPPPSPPSAAGAESPPPAPQPPPMAAGPADRPNIVVFYLDDVSPHDGRLWSDADLTPALHGHFVAHGIEFENAIGETPLCCPGRASLLTGLHTHNHGVLNNDALYFNPGMHIGKAMKDAGYASMFIGKYLNKNNRLSAAQWAQHGAGWTELDAIKGWNGDFIDYKVHTKQGNVHYPNTHSTKMVAQRAIQRMRETPADIPLFAVLSIYNLHAPNKPMAEFENDQRCASMPRWKPPNYNEADVSDKPAYVRRLPLLSNPNGWSMVGYCREMLGVDWAVQRVVDELETQGRLANTLLVFTADNGIAWGAHRLGQKKLSPYSTPVPLYMSWPAAWGTAPRTIGGHTSNIDLAPTFCAIAICTLGPFPTGQDGPDGLSLLPMIAGGGGGELGRDALFEYTGRWNGLRTTASHSLGLWHYVEHQTGELELYDLSADEWELENKAGKPAYDAIVDDLAQELAALRREGAARPDASIALAQGGPYVGVGMTVSIAVASQMQTRNNVQQGNSYDYWVRVRNMSDAAQAYRLRALATGSSSMSVRYFVGGLDVTSDVNGAGFQTTSLSPLGSMLLVVRISVSASSPAGAKKQVTIFASPVGKPGALDVVRAVAVR